MEDTRKEMFKVAKFILKFKDDQVNGKHSLLSLPGESYMRRGSDASSSSSPNKNGNSQAYINNSIGSPARSVDNGGYLSPNAN
jgi:hypothetical protein